MSFDPTKPVRTRIGKDARILATDLAGKYPIAAAVRESDGERVYTFTSEGYFISGSPGGDLDLENVPEERVRFLNLGNAHADYWPAKRRAPDFDVLRVTMEGDQVKTAYVYRKGDPVD